ncbi:hypothetical protein SeLEV6574_g01924 [Synchytrium endobioticum]|uniref:FAM86 N-terminal domain-containing protein n=1 Tax=Synchytrium endobioticum TaxID=286115 RepID=A0A507DAS1_9FUNG|nr:hypothetical protein SeLEV6574_g01924 [Synchytrium endobioticum]
MQPCCPPRRRNRLLLQPDEFTDFFANELDQLHGEILSCKRSYSPSLLGGIESLYDVCIENEPTLGSDVHVMLEKLGKMSMGWLINVLQHVETNSENEDDLKRITAVVANLSGRGARGAVTRDWTFGSNQILTIRDEAFAAASIGFMTWSASIVLADLLANQTINVNDKSVLELGCGTALSGLSAARFQYPRRVVLTDYHDAVLENARVNIRLNSCSDVASVKKLDWRDPPLDMPVFDTIIAADCIFEVEHACLVPVIAKRYLKPDGVFEVLLPLREKYKQEVSAFESNMRFNGWKLCNTKTFERDHIILKWYTYELL